MMDHIVGGLLSTVAFAFLVSMSFMAVSAPPPDSLDEVKKQNSMEFMPPSEMAAHKVDGNSCCTISAEPLPPPSPAEAKIEELGEKVQHVKSEQKALSEAVEQALKEQKGGRENSN